MSSPLFYAPDELLSQNVATIVNVVGYAVDFFYGDNPIFFLATDNLNDLHLLSDEHIYLAVDETTTIDPTYVIAGDRNAHNSPPEKCGNGHERLIRKITDSVLQQFSPQLQKLQNAMSVLETKFDATAKAAPKGAATGSLKRERDHCNAVTENKQRPLAKQSRVTTLRKSDDPSVSSTTHLARPPIPKSRAAITQGKATDAPAVGTSKRTSDSAALPARAANTRTLNLSDDDFYSYMNS
ncbi:hypothetical protein CYMTET_47761 [Cymbomonas tetramitiformis]|uniref:Uncharacterized protein n=1 Tax=Cymbomonas tetramitiformis TaxID=36881 RepID=A0AAE0EWF9_9CHLO|nr:hypothetical protein CYMTET_47761 [Cymbomonas tetramitiformis]|eukprot:gene364-688_t